MAFSVISDKDACYRWIEGELVKFRYLKRSRQGKGVVIRYLVKISGYSRQQLTRLIAQYRKTGRIRRRQRTVSGFKLKYSEQDIGLQFVVVLALWFGWSQAPKQLTVHVPPDLRSGAMLSLNEVPAANVYAFAFYIFQQLNRWPEDGAKDYGKAIFRISPYVTPRYRAEHMVNMEQKGRQGELAYRVRGMQEITWARLAAVGIRLAQRTEWRCRRR